MSDPARAGSTDRPPVVIIGMGNLLMGDEGIGVRLAEQLGQCGGLPAGVEVIDLGTAGLGALHVIAGRRKAVIIDCCYMNEAPGVMRRFTPEDVRSKKVVTRLSVHEADVMSVIELSKRLGECPEEVVLFGIQPQRVEQTAALSRELEGQLADYEAVLQEEVMNAAGVTHA